MRVCVYKSAAASAQLWLAARWQLHYVATVVQAKQNKSLINCLAFEKGNFSLQKTTRVINAVLAANPPPLHTPRPSPLPSSLGWTW